MVGHGKYGYRLHSHIRQQPEQCTGSSLITCHLKEINLIMFFFPFIAVQQSYFVVFVKTSRVDFNSGKVAGTLNKHIQIVKIGNLEPIVK